MNRFDQTNGALLILSKAKIGAFIWDPKTKDFIVAKENLACGVNC